MTDMAEDRLRLLGPGDYISHADLCRLVGPLPDCTRELEVTLESGGRRSLRRREVEGHAVWEAVG